MEMIGFVCSVVLLLSVQLSMVAAVDGSSDFTECVQQCSESTATNVAIGKVAWLSSLHTANGAGGCYPDGKANLCGATNSLDGDTNSDVWQGSCSHSARQKDPWWVVDLGNDYIITRVDIYNVAGAAKRTTDFFVGVSRTPFLPEPVPGSYPLCYHHPGTAGAVARMTCEQPMVGRYVIVQIRTANEYLNFCEVMVYGVPNEVKIN